jgi:ketosteroid isomerase-like protein
VGQLTTAEAVGHYLDALNLGDPDVIAGCVTEDFFNEHTSALGRSLHGRAAYRERLPSFLTEFTGLHYDVEDTIVERDRAAVAYTMTCQWGRERKPLCIRGVFRFRVAGGLIAHRVDYWDGAEVTRQLGPT